MTLHSYTTATKNTSSMEAVTGVVRMASLSPLRTFDQQQAVTMDDGRNMQI